MRRSYSHYILILVICIMSSIHSFGQATIIAGSSTTGSSTTQAYTVPAGNNRLVVVAVTGRVNAGSIGTITSVTFNGVGGTQAATVASPTGTATQRTSVYYFTEANIRSASAYCTAQNIVVNWSAAPAQFLIHVITLQNADQSTFTTGTGTNNNAGGTSTIALGAAITTGTSLDYAFYASAASNNRTHTAATSYTEITETVSGVLDMATASRQPSTTSENPSAVWSNTANLSLVVVIFKGITAISASPLTYYSRQNGAWDLNTTWSYTADGSSGAVPVGMWPGRTDRVVIGTGHNVTVNATDDNRTCSLRPDDLGGNVGAFAGSNLFMFYQTGDIIINGTLTVTGIEIMFGGYTHLITGATLSCSSSLVNVGSFEADSGTTMSSADDLCLAGNSSTIINTTSVSNDDLIMSWPQATLCGTGAQTLTNGSGSTVTYANGASATQICSTFSVACSGAGCSGFPVTGTGTFITGYTGPGGVGDATSNKMWFKADDMSLANLASISTWPEASGNGYNATQGTAGNRPVFNTNGVNTLPYVSFNGSQYMTLGQPSGLAFIPGTNSWSFFCVHNVPAGNNGTFFAQGMNNGGTRTYQYTFNTNAFTSFIGGIQSVGTVNSSNAWAVSSHVNNTTNRTSLTNETTNINNTAIGTSSVVTDMTIGARRDFTNADFGFPITGSIAEMAMYNLQLNAMQRIIIANYLAAKYNVTLSANDLYTQDGSGYDFHVAGIGQFTDGSNHKDARGSGIVRMWNPNSLANGDYMFWGSDSKTFTASTTSGVDGTVIKEKLSATWAVSETNDVGTVNIAFDLSGLSGNFIGSNLRLLIDRNNNGFADNDVTPVTGTFANNIVQFSGVNLQNSDKFTLGNTDNSRPLPISLLTFSATTRNGVVQLDWATATEVNNDFFTVLRSKNGEDWEELINVKGQGTTKNTSSYSTIDEKPLSNVSYYRLRQTDFNGSQSFSKVVKVDIEKGNDAYVYPNPSENTFTVQATFTIRPEFVRMVDVLGRIHQVTVSGTGNEVIVDASTVPAGVYFINVSDGVQKKALRVVKK